MTDEDWYTGRRWRTLKACVIRVATSEIDGASQAVVVSRFIDKLVSGLHRRRRENNELQCEYGGPWAVALGLLANISRFNDMDMLLKDQDAICGKKEVSPESALAQTIGIFLTEAHWDVLSPDVPGRGRVWGIIRQLQREVECRPQCPRDVMEPRYVDLLFEVVMACVREGNKNLPRKRETLVEYLFEFDPRYRPTTLEARAGYNGDSEFEFASLAEVQAILRQTEDGLSIRLGLEKAFRSLPQDAKDSFDHYINEKMGAVSESVAEYCARTCSTRKGYETAVELGKAFLRDALGDLI